MPGCQDPLDIMCCDIGLDRRILNCRDPLDASYVCDIRLDNCQDPPYVLLYRTQEDAGLSGSSGHFLCAVI